MEWTKTYGVLQEYAELIIEEYRANLDNDTAYRYPNRNASGALSNSLSYNLTLNEKSLQITISLEEYWKYIEYGTKPHFPPISAIKQWIEVKHITPRTNDLGKTPTTSQLAFLICRSISETGTKGTEPFHRAYQSAYEKMVDALCEAIREDYIENMKLTLAMG